MQETKKTASPSKKRRKPAVRRTYSWKLTALLAGVFILLFCTLWALFISGPVRVHEAEQEKVVAAMKEEVPGLEGLDQFSFAYLTWQGYTQDTLYWFDAEGQIITTRPMDSLNYNGAREKAAADYGMEADTVTLCWGYSGPVYELQNNDRILMLDYDTLEWVYERNTNG